MNRSTYLHDSTDTEAYRDRFLGDWTIDDPCRYANDNCRGKLFGALKDCRARRERSQALCAAKQRADADKDALRTANDMLRLDQSQVIAETRQAQLASAEYLQYGAIGLLALAGTAIVYKSLTRPKKK